METVKLDAVLWRCLKVQGLLEPFDSVEPAVTGSAGIYGAAPTAYLSLAARVKDFTAAMLDAALFDRRSLVRIPAMRGSIYLLPPELVPEGIVLAATGEILPMLHRAGITDAAYGGLVSAIESLLREEPKTAAQIRDGLTTFRERVPGTLGMVLRQMSHDGRIVRGRVHGGWQSQQWEYALMKDCVRLPSRMPTQVQALQRLAPLYFQAHGPATVADFAWWAGVSEITAKSALERLELPHVFLDKVRGIYLATKESLDEIATAPKKWERLTLLPYWDAYLMAHADRRRYLDAKWEDRVVDKSGNVTNVILRDGQVGGLWDAVGSQLRFAPFATMRAQGVRDAAAPFSGLFRITETLEKRVAGPLSERGQNAFQAPLA